ncbi:MAG TPA: diacylglycerol kinase family protein [Candidatus Acidoferrum sp.]
MSLHADAPGMLQESSSIVVFINPTAGAGRARIYLPRIQRVFESSGILAEFVVTRSAEELGSCARDAILRGGDLLLTIGGDGTFQALANATFGANVVLGIVPVGGGNDFAAALGMPSDPVRAVGALLAGEARLVDLVRVRTGDGRTRLYAAGGGIGLDAEAVRYASGAYHHLPGRIRYIASALTALAGFDALNVRIDFPGSDLPSFETQALLAAALNSPTYGAGLRLAPDATVDDGSLAVVMIEKLSMFEILTLLPRLMGSGELQTSRVKRWRARRVRFTTQQPCMFQGDGEILGPTPVEIEVVPKSVRVLAPTVG